MQPNLLQAMAVFFIFIFMTIILNIRNPTRVFAQADEQSRNCSSSFQCGNLSGVAYPFWGSNQPSYCGHLGFQLNCKGQAAEITIMNLTYQVLKINSQSQTLTVARADYIANLCPSVLSNTTLDPNLFTYAADIQNITLFYGCPNTNMSFPTTPGFSSPFSCNLSSVNSQNFYLTRHADSFPTVISTYLRTCGSRLIVPANQSVVQRIESNPTEENLVEVLEQGFGLQWTANDTLCKSCELSGGLCGYNSTASAFTCYCPGQRYPFTCATSSAKDGGKSNRTSLGIGLAIVATTIVIVCIGCYYCFIRRRGFCSDKVKTLLWENSKEDEKIEAFIMNYPSLMPKRYSYADIKKMTNSFIHKLGEGGFGGVYKGKLPDGRFVAIKVLSKSTGEGEEFINEVGSISRTSHVNIVTLLGFCYERTRRALIYKYMPNGSLDKFINDPGSQHDNCDLGWKMLYDIAIGTARGLEYLHRGCNTRIVHFDIKPHNILLDENFCPKISDFGLAKLCKGKESMVSMLGARGTAGYIAPEVFMRSYGGVSYKSDVYSYGMMIIEIFGGKNNTEAGVSDTSDIYFPNWIYKHIESGEISRLHRNITTEEEETIRRMIIVGLWCIQTNPSDRPSMTKVLEMLEVNVQSLQIPPKPLLFVSSTPLQYSSVASSAPENMITEE